MAYFIGGYRVWFNSPNPPDIIMIYAAWNKELMHFQHEYFKVIFPSYMWHILLEDTGFGNQLSI